MKEKICILDHTADAGVEIFGKTLEEIFYNAATAMYHILGCKEVGSAELTKTIELKEEGLEILLVTFLNELNYYITIKSTLLTPIQNLKIRQTKDKYILSFQTAFVSISRKLSETMPEIKSVTYHNLNIHVKNNMYHTHIFFDL